MPYTNMWAIIDNNGIIHSGTEEEMNLAFYCMSHEKHEICSNYDFTDKKASELIEKYDTEWQGDLKLIQIHDVTH